MSMKNYIEPVRKNIKKFFYRLNYAEGLDKEYDEACHTAFLKFLDVLYYSIVTCYFLIASATAYFLITDVLIK